MMSRINKYLGLMLSVVILSSCSSDDIITPDEHSSPEIIKFSANSSSISSKLTRAEAAEFPNDGKIGIRAALAVDSINWFVSPYLDNASATVKAKVGDNYSFDLDEVKYWPFDDSELVFMAYSPVASAEGAVKLNEDKTSLSLSLDKDMPDVLYASNNTKLTSYKKTMKTAVDLGEFKHALSQLTLKITADEISDVQLTKLQVVTRNGEATLDLLKGDNGLTIGRNKVFTYDLVSSAQDIIETDYKETVLLYPTTEAVTHVVLQLKEKTASGQSYDYQYPVSVFKNNENPDKPITLERAKNTTLSIHVKGKPITAAAFLLSATLTDWKYMGQFGININ